MIETFLYSFIPLFVAFDIFGVLPFYTKLVAKIEDQKRKNLLRDSITTSLLTTLFFGIVGNRIMIYIGISLKDFFIAGGIVLFIIAIRDLIGHEEEPKIEKDMIGVVPLGIPLLAGPAVLTTSIIIINRYGFHYFFFSLCLNLLICFYVMKFSEYIVKFLGRRLTEAFSKIFSLIIASIAIMFIRKGFEG